MRFNEISDHMQGIPFMEPAQGRIIYDFILEDKPRELLELGFGHGVSSCYMAAALDELGSGHITSVDMLSAVQWQDPSIETLLARTGLGNYVSVVREQNSYTWFLKNQIEKHSHSGVCTPIYDFCFIDGSKNWTIDGFAFFLIDKLLRSGGWILFDHLNWTYKGKLDRGQDISDGISIRQMSDDEVNTPHVALIFKLLVMQNPHYSNFKIQDDWWAWAQKRSSLKRWGKHMALSLHRNLRKRYLR